MTLSSGPRFFRFYCQLSSLLDPAKKFLARDIGLLADQVTAIRDGDLETPLDLFRRTQTASDRGAAERHPGGLHRPWHEQTLQRTDEGRLIPTSHDLKTCPYLHRSPPAELLRQEPWRSSATTPGSDEKARRLRQ